ncbi:hypothetical protein [Oceanithermus profundus]|uniref:hypothetical protein n=1 Tax=Oceanithermus profundus TaxID=187137 RepID=UPI001651831B|nr:hypothetical protein [Oceanithermus profundus]
MLAMVSCNQDKGPSAGELIPPSGGAVALPGNEVFVSVAPGIVEEPIRVRIEKVGPEDAPGPITKGVTVIKGVKVSLPGYDYSKPYAGNFKGRQLLVAFKAEGFVEEPNLFGDYYTAVCFWDDFEGRGTSGVLSWACRYGAESKIYDIQGEHYYFYWLDVVPPRGRYLYLVQYPKELSRRNCEAIGGVFKDDEIAPRCSLGAGLAEHAVASMGAWIRVKARQAQTLETDGGLKVVSVNLGDRELEYDVVCTIEGCFPVIRPNDHYWKFDPTDDKKWEYLWDSLLKQKRAHIYIFQEMMVEKYYCASEKIEEPNQHFCNGRTPRTNYMVAALLEAFGANWRDHWDYVCKAYECIVVNTDKVQFVDKNDPNLTRYVSFRWENGQVVEGDENDADSGILFATVWVKDEDGTWREAVLANDHLPSPLERHGAELRKAALLHQNNAMYQGQGGYPYSLDRKHSAKPLGSGFLPSTPVIKCGDMNTNAASSMIGAKPDQLALLTSVAFACPPDANITQDTSGYFSPYMRVDGDFYSTVAGGKMFDVCATTGEYLGNSGVATTSGTTFDGVGVDHNAIQAVLQHIDDSETVDVTVSLCPELADKAGLNGDGDRLNVPTCAWLAGQNYAMFDGPLSLQLETGADGKLHMKVPKALFDKGFLARVKGGTHSGLVESEYKCSAATGKCCKNEFSPDREFLPIGPGQTEYEICN